MEGPWKHEFAGPILRVPDSYPEDVFSNELLGDADTAGPETTL